MPSKTLTDLAPELLIQILKSSDSFADVTSLSSTSRKMFIIWETNNDVICDTILARTVPCYAQARELMEAQKKAAGNEHPVLGCQSAVDRAQWMLKGADTAASAFANFESDVCISEWYEPPLERDSLTLAGRTDFIRAFYRAAKLATLGEDSLPIRLLSSWNMLHLEQVRDVMAWLVDWYFNNADEYGFDSGLEWQPPDRPYPITVGVEKDESWANTCTSLTELSRDLYELTSKPYQASISEASFFPSIVRVRYPDEYETNTGAPLADLLKLAREKGTRYNVTYTLSEA